MWETIKKDPLIKTIVVILLGVLAFGFAFHIMFGAGSSSMDDGSMMGSGYSLGNTLENMIGILIKLVIIGLLIGIIVWIFRVITKQTGSKPEEHFEFIKEDPIIRNALIIIVTVLVLVFGFSFIKGFFSAGYGETDMMISGNGYSMYYIFYPILIFAIKVLILILMISLGYAFIMYLKENYKNTLETKDFDTISEETKECPDCRAKVKSNWKCCPYCGGDKVYDNRTE